MDISDLMNLVLHLTVKHTCCRADQSTIEANARFFDKIEDVPTQAISMGIKNILDAKSIILFAYGESKAEAIAGTVSGPVTESTSK